MSIFGIINMEVNSTRKLRENYARIIYKILKINKMIDLCFRKIP